MKTSAESLLRGKADAANDEREKRYISHRDKIKEREDRFKPEDRSAKVYKQKGNYHNQVDRSVGGKMGTKTYAIGESIASDT